MKPGCRLVKCERCDGVGEVDYFHVDHPAADLERVACPECDGVGQVERYSDRWRMADMRGDLTQAQASRALGWPDWKWNGIENGEMPIAHIQRYRIERFAAGWASVEESLERVRRAREVRRRRRAGRAS